MNENERRTFLKAEAAYLKEPQEDEHIECCPRHEDYPGEEGECICAEVEAEYQNEKAEIRRAQMRGE